MAPTPSPVWVSCQGMTSVVPSARSQIFFGGSPGIYAGGASRYSVSGRAKHHAKCKLQKAGLQPGLIFVAAGEARLYFARFASRCCDTG